MTIITGLSGNELYCMREKGFEPGNLVIGNSVFALGFVGGIASGLRTIAGGEIHEITSIIKEGRQLAYLRMVEEARRHVGEGVTGVTSQLILNTWQSDQRFIESAKASRMHLTMFSPPQPMDKHCTARWIAVSNLFNLSSEMSLTLLVWPVGSWDRCAA